MSNPSSTTVRPGEHVRRGAIGVLQRDQSFLMIQRSLNVVRGGMWCFPGGHVEPGETSQHAICRELREELGIDAQTERRLGSIRVLDSRHILVVWLITRWRGEFSPRREEIADFKWVSGDQIELITPGLPSNARVRELLGLPAFR